MTYSHETPITITAPPKAKTAAIGAMRTAMALYITHLPVLARRSWSHIAKARTMLRKLFKAEREVFAQWALSTLRSSPCWQERVLSDLGGHRALRRWERRQRLAHELSQRARETPRRARRGQTRSKPARAGGCTTDRFGLFRLAVISQNTSQPKSPRRRSGSRRSGYAGHRAAWNFDIKPIGITPDDLWGDLRGVSAASPAQRANANHETNRPETTLPETIWLDTCQQIVIWECAICAAEADVLCGTEAHNRQNEKTPP